MSTTQENVFDNIEHVIHILSLEHPNPAHEMHPGVTGSAIYYLHKWAKINGGPPTKIGAKENGNIAMVWEGITPSVAIDVQAAKQSADIMMQSPDGTITRKSDDEGSDAKALYTTVKLLRALALMAFTTEEPTDASLEQPETEQHPESPGEPTGITLQS